MVILDPVRRSLREVEEVFRDFALFLLPFFADEPFCELENF